MLPASGSRRRRTSRASVDLPLPDSPTRPSAVPASRENETPFTAWTAFPESRKDLNRFLTSSNAMVSPQDGLQEGPRIWMPGLRENGLRFSLFDDFALPQNGHS